MALKHVVLAIFDLDDTLLKGDSFFLWIEFLFRAGIIQKNTYEQLKAQERAYYQGTMDYKEYLGTYIRAICRCRMDWLQALAWRFAVQTLVPIVKEKAKELIRQHREQGHVPIVVTATDELIAKPLVKDYLGIFNILAIQFCKDEKNNRFLPTLQSTPSFRQGKVERLNAWIQQERLNVNLEESYFYSDSINDVFLLEQVGHPVAVDPDCKLQVEADMRGWPVVSLL